MERGRAPDGPRPGKAPAGGRARAGERATAPMAGAAALALHLQRTVGNQATLRYLRKWGAGTLPVQPMRTKFKDRYDAYRARYSTEAGPLKEPSDTLTELGWSPQQQQGARRVSTTVPGRSAEPFYLSYVDVAAGTLVVARAYRNEDLAAGGAAPPPYSEIMFQQWADAAEQAGRPLGDTPEGAPALRRIEIHHVLEKETKSALIAIEKPYNFPLPGIHEVVFAPGAEDAHERLAYERLMATPFGKVVRHLLADHGDALGARAVGSITMRVRGLAFDLVFHLGA